MVEKRCEPYPLFLTCYFPHAEQAVRRVDPALSLGRGRPFGVLFGQSPSLHTLRRRFPAFVWALRRYYATVRLPTNVHVGLLAHDLLQPARTPTSCRALIGPPGSRAWSFHACLGSKTAQSPADTRASVSTGVAFRTVELRRHSGRDYFAARYPACMCPCQRFAPNLATGHA
jgi:hypothetical protein